MSSLLFPLYVKDLELDLQCNADSGLLFDDIVLIPLLFADDMAFIGKTSEETQNNLDNFYRYCENWGLKVNTTKTKNVVFC